MRSPAATENENERLTALNEYSILDTIEEKEYDDITHLAAFICQTPISLISLIDDKRQWFKSKQGLDVSETPKEYAFCAHAILNKDKLMVVPDSRQDERFHDNPLVTGEPFVIFYAGIPLVSPQGHPLGTLCVIDKKPNQLDEEQKDALEKLGNQIIRHFEARKTNSRLKDTQLQLIQLEKMASLGILAAGVGHEINNPLNFIQSGLKTIEDEIVEQGDGLSTRLAPYIKIINDGTKRASDIVKSLSRLSRKTTELNEPCNIHQILENCLVILSNKLGKDIEISKELVDDHLLIVGGEGQIHQVFLNLISNAIDAIQGPGMIKINTQQKGDMAVITLKDNGKGIPQEHLNRLGSPFFTTKEPGKGTGLGLYITSKIIEDHNGSLQIHSQPGMGTEIIIKLPIAQKDENTIKENDPLRG